MIVNAEERTYTHENTSIFINENATTKLSDNNYNTYVTLNTGDAITIDMGCKYKGYCSDMTRTVVIGKADSEMKKVYETVYAAQTAALEAYDFGKTGAQIDAVAREIIYKAGYEGCFGHGLGHGVGMDIHEAPGVSSASATPFETGHVVTCEPGIYLEGKYGVRIEDMVVFGENSVEDITRSPKNLIEL